jgi:UDP-2,4-diacetamido-2,4,6-trideoxy-beta-L-altropyranose hydrolase
MQQTTSKICFRADASRKMGTGHLMRCLTLADGFAAAGAEVDFLCVSTTTPWRPLVEARGHRYVLLAAEGRGQSVESSLSHADWLPWGQQVDASAVLAVLPQAVEWLIVDHYALDARWELAVRPRAGRLLAIDDIADRPHACDVLLDHNPQEGSGARYSGLVPADATRLIGPQYALLRPGFAKARALRKPAGRELQRINVFMGGTDAIGATLLVLQALSVPELSDIAVDVMIGAACPHLPAIQERARYHGNTLIHVDTPDVASLVAAADLCIGAGGVAALERCCIGVGSVTIAVAANQEPALAALAQAGAILHLGSFDQIEAISLRDCVISLRRDSARLARVSTAAAGITDGKGTDRVLEALSAMQFGHHEYRHRHY